MTQIMGRFRNVDVELEHIYLSYREKQDYYAPSIYLAKNEIEIVNRKIQERNLSCETPSQKHEEKLIIGYCKKERREGIISMFKEEDYARRFGFRTVRE
jgi:hypothetical protein